MSTKGPAPKPSAIRKLEGMRGHRPLPKNEVDYGAGIPDKPKGMSRNASRIWDELVKEMAGAAVLQSVDGHALAQLARDQALLEQAYEGIDSMLEVLQRKSDAEGKPLPGGALVAFLSMPNGHSAMGSIRDLANRVIVERREFGLTPSSRTRVSTTKKRTSETLDDAIFQRGMAEMLVLPKPN